VIRLDIIAQVKARLLFEIDRKKRADDPVAWARYMLGEEYVPYSKIREAVVSFLTNRRSLTYGVNSSGKSYFLVGVISLWWLDVHDRDSKVMIVAPSYAQSLNAMGYTKSIKSIIDDRFAAGIIDHTIAGNLVEGDGVFKMVGGSGGIQYRNPTPHNAATVLKGAHSPSQTGGTLVILEEASGLLDSVLEAAHNVVTGSRDKLLAVTNPNNPHSYVMRNIVKPHINDEHTEWGITKISWFDMPAYTGEEVSGIQATHLLQAHYVDDVIARYGTESPEYRMYVLSEPDYESKMTLIRRDAINAGINCELPEDDFTPRPVFGVDIASTGDNSTMIYAGWTKEVLFIDDDGYSYTRDVTKIRYVDSLERGKKTKEDTDAYNQVLWILKRAIEYNAKEIRFDASGIGAQFEFEFARAVEKIGRPIDIKIYPMKAPKREAFELRYANNRAWWWDNMRERLISGEIDLPDNDPILIDELMSVPYREDNAGRILLEPKRNLSRSPDRADAAVFCAVPDDAIELIYAPKKEYIEAFSDYTSLDIFAEYVPEDPFSKVML